MANNVFDPQSFIASRGLVLKSDLNTVQALNSYWSNIPEFYGGHMILQTYIKKLKAYYTAKFEYSESDEVDTFLLEEFLWHYGECAIVRMGDKIIIGKFTIITQDYNGYPERIKIFPVVEANTQMTPIKREFVVGKDAVIVRDDRPTHVNGAYVLSPFYAVHEHLKGMMVARNEINKNMIVNRTIIKVPPTTKESIIKRMGKWLFSGQTVLPTGDPNPLGNSPTDMTVETFELRDRHTELMNTYYFHYDGLKEIVGADSNAMPQKKERQINQEINMNNVISNGVSHTKLKMRERGLKDLLRVLGISLTVELREVKEKEAEQEMFSEIEKGVNDGSKRNQNNTGS